MQCWLRCTICNQYRQCRIYNCRYYARSAGARLRIMASQLILTKSTKGNTSHHPVASSNPRPNTPTAAPTAPQLQTCLTAVGSTTPQALVAFSHAALFSPALFTLTTALTKGFLPPMPGRTLATLCKHPPKSAATIKGHLDQICKNL
jgi:hypothetical protein